MDDEVEIGGFTVVSLVGSAVDEVGKVEDSVEEGTSVETPEDVGVGGLVLTGSEVLDGGSVDRGVDVLDTDDVEPSCVLTLPPSIDEDCVTVELTLNGTSEVLTGGVEDIEEFGIPEVDEGPELNDGSEDVDDGEVGVSVGVGVSDEDT